MGIENERKLLLDVSCSQDTMRRLRSDPSVSWYDITQGYLSGSCRIRHVVPHVDPIKSEQFIFTFKTKVRGSTVEIENPISTQDYQKLFLICKPVIVKTRAKIVCGDYTWDIDFLRKHKSGEIYLAIAEVEMPEFATELPLIHELLSPHAIKWIDQGDKRFNNRNLSNPKKATKAIEEITDVKNTAK
jgi:CYTH domain-containing protein